jgi:DNA repair protein RadD
MVQLRDYQERAIESVRDSFRQGNKRTLLVSPTGSGKTLMFSYISAGMARNDKRIVIIAHRRELLKQISKALKNVGVRHALLTAGTMGLPRANVVVASVFTLARRLSRFPAPDLIIGDEAHHFTPESTWGKVVKAFPEARVLGVTATPERLDGKGLGLLFDDMVIGPTVAELTEQGYLSPAEVYAPSKPDLTNTRTRMGDYVTKDLEETMDKPSITGSAVTHYTKLAPGRRAVAFCVSVKHAKDVAQDFRNAGYHASHVDGGMDEKERDGILAKFEAGEIQILTSCDLISEGFDLPAIEVAILLRPTKSLSMYLQQVGRAIRPSPGKDKTVVLDHAGNTKMHGFIDEHREWMLTSDRARKKQSTDVVPSVRSCPTCFAMHRPTPACPKCGHVYQLKSRKVQQVDGELVQISRAEDAKQASAVSDLSRRFTVLKNIGRGRGYSHPDKWAFNVICGQESARLAKIRSANGGVTTNGLTVEERSKIWNATIGKTQTAS